MVFQYWYALQPQLAAFSGVIHTTCDFLQLRLCGRQPQGLSSNDGLA